jgi:hypothetical protein
MIPSRFLAGMATPTALIVLAAMSAVAQPAAARSQASSKSPGQAAPSTAGAFTSLPPKAHYDTSPSTGGATVSITTGHVGPKGHHNKRHNPPPPKGIPLDGIMGARNKLVIVVNARRGQRLPNSLGLEIVDSAGNVVYQSSLACVPCRSSRGPTPLGLNAQTADAISAFMTSGNLLRVVTDSVKTSSEQIPVSIGVRSDQ